MATISYAPIVGRKVVMNDPDLGALIYFCDSLGNLVEQTDVKGQRITMEYHVLNRLVRRVVEASSLINCATFTQRTGYLGSADKADWIEYPSGLAVINTRRIWWPALDAPY